MCIALPREQKTRSGTKYTGYVHKLILEDEEKTSDFFQIILAYNGSTHYLPCLLETHRDFKQSLTNIESCIQGALHDVNSLRELLPDGELKDFIGDMQYNLKEMHLKLKHVDANSGTIMPMKRVKVQTSEQPKKKPKSTASDASGSSVIQSPKKTVPGFVDPETSTYSDNITLPANQSHCVTDLLQLMKSRSTKMRSMCMEYTFAFSVRRSCLIQEYVGNMCAVFI